MRLEKHGGNRTLHSIFPYFYTMKFRTEIPVTPLCAKIGYENRILLLGSCFAAEIGRKLAEAKFDVAYNPTGTLFNPSSVAALLRLAQTGKQVTRQELRQSTDGCRFHYATDTSFDAPDPAQVLTRINTALDACRKALAGCDRVIVTYGTAWVYRLRESGLVVANCHKQPQDLFERQRLTVAQIVSEWSELLATTLAGKGVILTVSPIRHLGDGLPGNAVSKATLRLAAEELAARFSNVCYFPAFELLTDDLRDYRFYADDLVHPSTQAVEYIWEKFAEAAFGEHTRQTLDAVQQIVRAARHIPRQPQSEAFRGMCRRILAQIEVLEKEAGIDFSAQRAYFLAHLSE